MWEWGECRVPADALMHYGVSGQKKGVRRYQNPDGTYTAEGRQHYGIGQLGTGRLSRKIERVNTKYNAKIAEQKSAANQLRSIRGQTKDVGTKKFLAEVETDTRNKMYSLQAKQKKKADKYKAKLAAKQQRVADKYDAKINRQKEALVQYSEAKKKPLSGSERDLIKSAEGLTREEIRRLTAKRNEKMSRY